MGGHRIRGVAAGNEHTCVLTENGIVLMAGYNDNGQCGQGTTERVDALTHLVFLHQYILNIHRWYIPSSNRMPLYLQVGSTETRFGWNVC